MKKKKYKFIVTLIILFLLIWSGSSVLAFGRYGDAGASILASRLDSCVPNEQAKSVDFNETECVQPGQSGRDLGSGDREKNNQNENSDEGECERAQLNEDKKELNANLVLGYKVYDATTGTENISLFYCPEAMGIQPGDDVSVSVEGEFESKDTGVYHLQATIIGKDAGNYYFGCGKDEIVCVILPRPIQGITWTCDEINGHYFKYDGNIKKPTGRVTSGVFAGDDVKIGKSITTTEQSLEMALTSVIGTDTWLELLNEIKICNDVDAFFRDSIVPFINDIMIQWKTEAIESRRNGYFEFALCLEGVDARNYCILDFEPVVKALFETECGFCPDKDVNLTMPGIPKNVFWWFNIKGGETPTPISPEHVDNNVVTGISGDSAVLSIVVALIVLACGTGFVGFMRHYKR